MQSIAAGTERRPAHALEPVLTPASEPIVAAAMSRVPPPCGAALQSIQLEGSRIRLAYDHPAFAITIVHPGATREGQRVGPYRVLDEGPAACPQAASQIVAGLQGQSLADPWSMPVEEPEGDAAQRAVEATIAPHPVQTWIGGAILLVHVVLLGALIVRALRRRTSPGLRGWRAAPLAIAILGGVARLATPPFVFNWYSFTEESPARVVDVAPGFVGLERVLGHLWPSGVPMTEVVAFVGVSGGLSAGLAVLLAGTLALPRRTALVAGLLMALWPALVRMGASDAQHPIALTVWLAFCLVWARARERGGGRVALLLVVGALLPLVRVETLGWIPAAVVLLPPRRRTPLASWLVLVVVGIAAAALTLPVRQIGASMEGSILDWVLSPLTTSRGMSVAPLVLGALGALGLTVLAVANRGLAARLLACALVVALPALVSGKLPANPLTLRYFLPAALVLLVFCAAGLSWLGDLLAPARWLAPVLGVLLLSAAEAPAWISPDAQYTFRHEVPFLRAAMSRLPGGSAVCMLDPGMNDWPGPHHDIDTAWSPRGGGRYYGMESRLVVVAEPGQDVPCDYYYEGVTCALDPADPVVGEDAARFRQLCDAWHERIEGPPIATEDRKPIHYGTWLLPGPVHLSLYRVRPSVP
jgi:hypothetical protein